MTYQVLARKWRPQAFEAVVGQEAITRTLKNALVSGRIAHAYLFAGPRGVGKTTTARLLARALLCPERRGAEPCGTCPVCREAQAGTIVDIIEIDAASNRGIDEIRALRENVKYAPARGRYKIYIVDEVHQLTAHAFDALLKTLEEPPPHVVFILATTDPRDVPPTVLSRVQRFDFRPIPPETLVKTLERILLEEQVPFEPAALPVLARAAEGSLRDALSLLDTAIAYGEGRLEAAAVAQLLGATAPEEIRRFCESLLGHDPAGAVEAIDRAVRQGEDLGAFARDAIELLRRALVLKAAPSAQLSDLAPAEANALRRLGEAVSLDELLYAVKALLDADALMRESPHPRVELEMAAVRAARRPVPQALDDVLRRIDEAQARLALAPAAAGPPVQETLLGDTRPGEAASAPRREPGRSASEAAAARPASVPRPQRASQPEPPPGSSPPAPEPDSTRAATLPGPSPAARPPDSSRLPGPPRDSTPTAPPGARDDLAVLWQRVVEDVMAKKPMLGAVLAQARVTGLTAGTLSIVAGGNHFHRDLLADRANRELVQAAVRRQVPGAERLHIAEDDATGTGLREHPVVQAVIEGLEGEVVAVRPRPPEGDGQ